MKPAVIRQVRKPQLFKGTQPHCICVCYYNKKETYMVQKNHATFVPHACHFKSFDRPEMEGINTKKLPFFIHVRVLISDDGPMLQIREVTEGSNNTKKANTVIQRLKNSQKQVTIKQYFSESPLHT